MVVLFFELVNFAINFLLIACDRICLQVQQLRQVLSRLVLGI